MYDLSKSLFVLVLISFLFLGCAGFQVEREVVSNKFTSNIPNVSVEIDPAFIYVGNPHKSDTAESIGGRIINEHFDSYCFISPNGNVASRAITVQFHRTQHYFVSDFFRNVGGLQEGKQELGGKAYQFYVKDVHPTTNSPMTRLIVDEGYVMPFGLVKVFGRIYGVQGDMLVKFYYYESLDQSGLEDLSWKTSDDLNDEQLEYLNNFNERAGESFQLLSR